MSCSNPIKNDQLSVRIFSTLICLYPVLALSVNGAGSLLFFIISSLSLVIFFNDIFILEEKYHFSVFIVFFVVMFVSPVFATLFVQMLDGSFIVRDFDSPIRLALGLPIFLVIRHKKLEADNLIVRNLPIALFVIAIIVFFFPQMTRGDVRVTLASLDQLTFGYLCLLFALLSLVSIEVVSKKSSWLFCYSVIGTVTGIGLSVLSQSRTGWLSIPIVLLFYFYSVTYKLESKLKIRLIILITLLVTIFASYSTIGIIKQRINQGFYELSNHTYTSNTDKLTSVGERLNYWLIGFELIKEHPLRGVSHSDLIAQLKQDKFQKIADARTLAGLPYVGFHNEFVTACVNFGISGFVSRILLCIVPLVLIFKTFFVRNYKLNQHALLAITYLSVVIISGFTYDIYCIKRISSLHSLFMATLYGSLLWRLEDFKTSLSYLENN